MNNDGIAGEGDHAEADFELVLGGIANDTLIGGPGGEQLEGGDGDDHLIGGGGADEMIRRPRRRHGFLRRPRRPLCS